MFTFIKTAEFFWLIEFFTMVQIDLLKFQILIFTPFIYNVVNSDGKIGAVGFLPQIVPRFLSPVDLVRVDEKTGDLIRTKPDNFGIRCQPGISCVNIVLFGLMAVS